MLHREDVLEKLRAHYPYLAEAYGVKRIGLFGSVAAGRQTEHSDVDIVVEFDAPIGLKFVALATFLEDLLGAEVDILTDVGVSAIRIPHISESIRQGTVYVEPV
jgi:uncharacterized protein